MLRIHFTVFTHSTRTFANTFINMVLSDVSSIGVSAKHLLIYKFAFIPISISGVSLINVICTNFMSITDNECTLIKYGVSLHLTLENGHIFK